jgi:hypothetical protein
MRSRVAETLEADDRARNLALTVEERFVLMRELGERELQAFMSANGIDRDEAMRRIEHAGQRDRNASAVMQRVIDASRPNRSSDPR